MLKPIFLKSKYYQLGGKFYIRNSCVAVKEKEKKYGVCNAFQVSLDLLSVSVVSRGYFSFRLHFNLIPALNKNGLCYLLIYTWSTKYCRQMA